MSSNKLGRGIGASETSGHLQTRYGAPRCGGTGCLASPGEEESSKTGGPGTSEGPRVSGTSRPVGEGVGGGVASPQTSLSAELGASNQRAQKKGHQEPLQRSHAGGQRSFMFVLHAESSQNLPAGKEGNVSITSGISWGTHFCGAEDFWQPRKLLVKYGLKALMGQEREDPVSAPVSEFAARGEFSNIGVSRQPL